ncbi:DUF1697 domain-containing protein [Miltoncostaea marina]|uniref:DUF1697 domain-containing protein n=1 Tax=Miltoncostaea marina TaxID=2843215 RepID=UPI001C3DD09C|nr:DUF1697 domain-containing protein [Miltoncostaea marina]
MARRAALLRGVNLGPARRLAMPALRDALAAAGYDGVATALASGNVVLTTRERPSVTERRVREVVAERFGMDVDVVVRTAAEMGAIVEGNPLADVADDSRRLQVMFLGGEPAAGALEGLEAMDLGPDAVRVRGREVYVWSGGGIARSPALKELGRRPLGVTATARNWSTVLRLRGMLEA